MLKTMIKGFQSKQSHKTYLSLLQFSLSLQMNLVQKLVLSYQFLIGSKGSFALLQPPQRINNQFSL